MGLPGDRGRAGIPDRSQTIRATKPSRLPRREPAKNDRPVAKAARTAMRGLVDALVAAVVSVAVRETIAYFGPSAGKIPGT